MRRLRQTLALATAVVTTVVLTACTAPQQATWDTARSLLPFQQPAYTTPPRPEYRYLRVTANGRAALMALASIETDALGQTTEVWMGGGGSEIIRLQDGRLTTVIGTTTEWRRVQLPVPMPRWPEDGTATSYARVRDEMPGYLAGLRERVELREIPAPFSHQMVSRDASQLRWYEETQRAVTPSSSRPGPARYAVTRDAHPVVAYGEQCLSSDLCLSWEPLPWQPPTPAKPS